MAKHILFCVYHDLNSEERSKELLKILNQLGNVDIISRTKELPIRNNNIRAFYAGEYIDFIKSSIKKILNSKYDICVVHDNYGALLVPFIKIFQGNTKIIYDSSELYPIYELKTKAIPFVIKFKSYLLAVCEKLFIKKADLVIAANAERASFMKRYYKITKEIIIYDNIHFIDDEYDPIICEKKYSELFAKDKFAILNAGGIFNDRYIFELADAVREIGDDYLLLVVGGGVEREINRFKEKYEGNDTVRYLGFIPRIELKYLIQKSNLCFTGFKPISINNIYCASGKTYESLMEGTPILCSDNPPLAKLCNDLGVGIADNDFSSAIMKIRSDYDFYKKNAVSFKDKIDYWGRYNQLIHEVKDALKI